MMFLKKYSLPTQFTLVYMLLFLSIIAALSIYIYKREIRDIKVAKLNSMNAVSKSISVALKEDIYNKDYTTIEVKLFGLNEVGEINSVTIYNKKGMILSELSRNSSEALSSTYRYGRSDVPLNRELTGYHADDSMIVIEPIHFSGQVIAWIEIKSSPEVIQEIRDNIRSELFIVCCVIFTIAGLAFFYIDFIKKRHLQKERAASEIINRTQKMDALGKLTGGIAHDYNNMLGVIIGYAELLEEMLDGQPKLAEYAHQINRAGIRGANLTKKLLSFSRKTSSDPNKLDINTLLREEKDMLEKTLTARIRLKLDLENNLSSVWLDDADLEDAILNMCINSMHAIEGNGQITIQTSNQSLNKMDAQALNLTSGDYVLLSISDTGCGMDRDTQEKIFEPFYSTKGEKGTGLGLSQVYGVVQRSGGVIKVYSEPWHGTRFTLYFPRYSESSLNERQAEDYSAVSFTGNVTILVVDDELDLLNLTSEILERHGFKIFSAESAQKALDILEGESIDLLVSDIIMPEMDGYQLASIVKEKYPSIKIQLVSGFTDIPNKELTNENLQQDILLKPFTAQALLQRINKLINAK